MPGSGPRPAETENIFLHLQLSALPKKRWPAIFPLEGGRVAPYKVKEKDMVVDA